MNAQRSLLTALVVLALAGCEYGGVGGRPGGQVPADPHVAASPEFVIQTTNQGYQTLDRLALKFYAGPYPLPGCGGDARVYYDGTVRRWYMVSQIPTTAVCLAVSSSWHPFAPWFYWYLYRDNGSASDYPTLSWSDRHLLVTQAQPGGAAFVLDKGQALAGNAVTYTYLAKLNNSYAARMPSNELRNNAFLVEPGTGSPPSGIWIKRFEGYVPNLTIRATRVDTQNYGNAPFPVQPAPGPALDLRGIVVLDAMVVGNRIYALMADADNGHAAMRLFRIGGIDSAGLNLTLESSTLVRLDGNDAFFGSLGKLWADETWIGGNCSGAGLFISACLAVIPPGSAPAIKTMTVVKGGTTVYAAGTTVQRWGDYTSIAPDWRYPGWVWYTAQVALSPNVSETRTWVMNVTSSCDVATRTCPQPTTAALAPTASTDALDMSGVIVGSPTVDSVVMENGATLVADVGVTYPVVPEGLVLPQGD